MVQFDGSYDFYYESFIYFYQFSKTPPAKVFKKPESSSVWDITIQGV